MAETKPKPVVVTESIPVPDATELQEVYQFTLEDGQVHAWHGTPEDLVKVYPDAVINGQLMVDELGQGYFVAYEPAKAAPKKSAPPEKAEPEKEDDSNA